MNKAMSITIDYKDIEKREIYSDSGRAIDALAYSADQWTSLELDENNLDAATESLKYVFDNFDFEAAALKASSTVKKMRSLCASLGFDIEKDTTRVLERSNLQPGAYYALHYPEKWSELLEAYKQKAEDERWSFYDSEWLIKHAPELAKELQDAESDAQAQLYKEWLHGDYRDYAGVITEIRKEYGADDADYNEKEDAYTLHYDADNTWLHDELCGCYEDKHVLSVRTYKKYLLTRIQSNANARHEKEKREREKRREERERVQAYQKEQHEKAEAERIEKLKGMKKRG